MSYKNLATWRIATKTKLCECLGGKCNKCGYSRCIAALDFHHLKDKEFEIAQAISAPVGIDRLVKEVKKCILLCSNCHRELHNGLWNLDEIIPFEFDESKLIVVKGISTIDCRVCGKPFNPKNNKQTLCSIGCRNSRAGNRCPSKAELESLVWIMPATSIAERYGVSDKAVGKWCKKLDIDKPGRGYWRSKI